MSQFKILIDEREEAKRNFEQLKAEIGSTNSGLGEPSNGSSMPQPKASVTDEVETSGIQSASTPAAAVVISSQNLPTRLPNAALPLEAPAAAPTPQIKENEPKPVPANIRLGTSYGEKPQGGSSVGPILLSLMHGIVIVFCCPCVFCYRRRKIREQIEPADGWAPYPVMSMLEPAAGPAPRPILRNSVPSPHVPAETAYQNLGRYGPEGIFEMESRPTAELPAPHELHSYYEMDSRPY